VWTVDYLFSEARPSGAYKVQITAEDQVGNRRTSANATVLVDASPATAGLTAGSVTTGTLALGDTFRGTVSDLATLPGAVLQLHLDEAAGANRFVDTSGRENAVSCVGSCPTAGAPGKFGPALRFNGGQGLTAADTVVLRQAPFTLAGWFEWGGLNGASEQYLFAKAPGRYELHTGGAAGTNGLRFAPAGDTSAVSARASKVATKAARRGWTARFPGRDTRRG
jgi:hypothetical protein